MLRYAQYSRIHKAWSQSDANCDHKMPHSCRCSLLRRLVDLRRGRGAADGCRLESYVLDLRHPGALSFDTGAAALPAPAVLSSAAPERPCHS